jgi:uncharacterized membrane protein YccC
MADEHPRRRITDRDRRRWPDERLDEMNEALQENNRDTAKALRAVARLEGMRDVAEAQRDLIEFQGQRVTDIARSLTEVARTAARNTAQLAQIQRDLDRRFDAVDEAHERTEKRATGVDPDTGEPLPPPFRPDIRFWLKLAAGCATGVGMPIAIALLTGGHG